MYQITEKQEKEATVRGILAELMQCIEEQKRLKVRLRVAIEVKNTPLIEPTQKSVEILESSIDALKRILTEESAALEKSS